MTIAEESQALLALVEDMEHKIGTIHTLIDRFNQHVWNTTMNIVGDLHDPLITTVGNTTRYADELLSDYVKNMKAAQKAIKRKGNALREIDRRSY